MPQGDPLIKCSLHSKRLKTVETRGPSEVSVLGGGGEGGGGGLELGPVGCRTGHGDQFDWCSLWVKLGHGWAGRMGSLHSWLSKLRRGGRTQGKEVAAQLLTGGLGSSWSLRHPQKVPPTPLAPCPVHPSFRNH